MKRITLSNGMETLVDDQDYHELILYKWQAVTKRGKSYAARYGSVYMHRQISGAKTSAEKVDHINGNTLDNRRDNLRICTNAQNMQNRSMTKSNKTGFKGVSLEKASGKYVAQIQTNWKKVFLGRFNTPKEAHTAYLEAAEKYHQKFMKG